MPRCPSLWTCATIAALAAPCLQAQPSTDAYAYDPAFNQGAIIEDRFAAFLAGPAFHARKLVALPDGGVVVAGLVPAAFGAAQDDGLSNLGLVRYGSAGERVAWPSPSPQYGYFEGRYLGFPNTDAATFDRIGALVHAAGHLYALVDAVTTDGTRDVGIVAFGEDGSFVGHYPVFDTGLSERGAGLVAYTQPGCHGVLACTRLVAVATYTDGAGRDIITAKRLEIGSSGPPAYVTTGTLEVDTGFGPFGNGANDYPAPDFMCAAAAQCPVVATTVAATHTEAGQPVVYVGATSRWEDGDPDVTVLAIDGASGYALAGFGVAGFAWHPIDDPMLPRETTVAIAARAGTTQADDRIDVAVQVQGSCLLATGVKAYALGLLGTGLADPSFGTDGRQPLFEPAANCLDLAPSYDFVRSATLAGERFVIAGEIGSAGLLPVLGAPLVLSVRARDGRLMQRFEHLPVHADGAPWSAYGIHDIVAAGQDRVTVAGELESWLPEGLPFAPARFGTARLAPDRIFGDGLDG